MTIDEWKLLLDEDPSNELVRFSYAKCLLDEKRWAEASTQFQTLVDEQPDYALAWAFLARSLYEQNRHEEARHACEKGLPHARAQKHQVPEDEILAVLDGLDSEF